MKITELIYIVSLVFAIASIFVIYKQIKPQRSLLLGYLTGYLLILVLSNLAVVMIGMGWMSSFPHFYKVTMPFSLLSPVISYWYVKGCLGWGYKLKWVDVLHLLPFVLVFIHYTPFFVLSADQKASIIRAVTNDSELLIRYPYGFIFTEPEVYVIRTVQAIIYQLVSHSLLYRFAKQHSERLINKRDNVLYNWIKFFVWTISAYLSSIIFCYIIWELTFKGFYLNEILEQLVFLITAVFVFALSSYLLLNPKALFAIDQVIEQTNGAEHAADASELKNTVLEMSWHKSQDLTQPQLIEKLQVKNSDFSTALKLAGYQNFNEFINSIRLECFIETATPDELQRNSIEGIANACGFKSPATFYRVFKEKYGTTPKRYLDNLKG